MDLPPDQKLLYQDLCTRLDRQDSDDDLIRFMGEVMRSLLRRQGDAQFLVAVQDSFTNGLMGLDHAEKRLLAREIIALVITKRPEIARAWQALHPEAVPVRRRATDDGPPDLNLPDLNLIEGLPMVLAGGGEDGEDDFAPAGPAYDFAQAEKLVAAYVAEVLERRLSIFTPPELKFPSVAYSHDQPFFLFAPVFPKVARRFVIRVLLPLVREPLERHVYRQISPSILADDQALAAFLTEKRPDIWKIIIEKLGKLSGHHRCAEAKLVAAENGQGAGPEFQVVEVPVRHPRIIRVLGVPLTIGSTLAMKKTRVRVRPSVVPDADEMDALNLIDNFRDIAADAGMDLPAECDFGFLRALFEFDAKKYAQSLSELIKLALHKETTRIYLFERLKFLDEAYSNYLSDALIICLFTHATSGAFGFQELYDVCVGTDKNSSALASKRPFVPGEVARRPRDLAFQLREALKRRADRNTTGLSVVVLFEVWKVMAKTRFKQELDAALTVFAAFPVAFAGDPDEAILTEIGTIMQKALTADKPDSGRTVDAVLRLYGPLADKNRPPKWV